MTGAAKPAPPPVVRRAGSRVEACFPAATPPTVTAWTDDAFPALHVLADEDGTFLLAGAAEDAVGGAPDRPIARFAERDDALAALGAIVEAQGSAPSALSDGARRGLADRVLQAFTAICLATITVGLVGGWSGVLTGAQSGSCLSGGDPDAIAAMIAAINPPRPAAPPLPPLSPPPPSPDLGAFDVEKVMQNAAQTSSRIRSRLVQEFVAQNPQIFNRPTPAPAVTPAAAEPAEAGFTAFGLGTPSAPPSPSP